MVHGGREGGSGDPGSKHSEVEKVSTDKFWEEGGNEKSWI
jgi:hypothetical protein